MPADVEVPLAIGSAGLNLRDSPLEVGPTGLIDSLNWRLDAIGALVKTLGDTLMAYAATNHNVLELAAYNPSTSSGSAALLSYLNNGTVVRNDVATPTVIASGLSTTAHPSFAQMLDKIFWSNGTDAVQQWDGATLTAITGINDVQTITTTGVPTGGTFTLTIPELGATTTALPWNATAAQVQSALLTLVGAGNVAATGGALPTGIVVTFQGALANQNRQVLTHSDLLTGGTNPAVAVTHTTPGRGDAPRGKYLAVWRNRLWISGVAANPSRVYWSGAGDPTVWTATNFVDILGPRGDVITGLKASPNIGSSFDGADGVLVFKNNSAHRIIDDSDNVSGITSGGANVLVDNSTGTINARTIAEINGRVYCAARNGIYSTDGHTPLILESAQLGWLIPTITAPSSATNMLGFGYRGSYILSFTRPGDTTNGTLLELYTTLGHTGQHPIMPLAQLIDAATLFTDVSGGEQVAFSRVSDGAGRVYQLFAGGTFSHSGGQAIPATATTGVSTLGMNHQKRVRRIRAVGRGQIQIGLLADYATGSGDQQQFLVDTSGTLPVWGAVTWNNFVWATSGDVGVVPVSRYFGTRGRWFAFVVSESSTQTGLQAGGTSLSTQQPPQGGAVLQEMLLTVTPLANEV